MRKDKNKKIKDKRQESGFTPLEIFKSHRENQKKEKNRQCRESLTGFTLIEITVSVSLVVLIGALSLVSWVNSRLVHDLTAGGQNALSLLRTAQTNAATGADASQWGVRVGQNRIVLFRGSTYGGATASTSYALPSTIEIVNIALSGGGSDVIFKRITGYTDQSGTLLMRVAGSATKNFPITVDASGAAYRTGTAALSTGTRIIDSRHRAFALGWSIKNSVTLALNFDDGTLINSVAMAGYFNGDKSVFDWSGTTAAGSQNQVVRVHTTSLTDSDTVLSVDRDCRRNTKKLKISIDAKDIATYGADCKTVTVGAFGGAMSEP